MTRLSLIAAGLSGGAVLIGATLIMFVFVHSDPTEAIARLCWRTYQFEPQADITAYQVAQIVARLKGPAGPVICVGETSPIPDDLLPQFRRIK